LIEGMRNERRKEQKKKTTCAKGGFAVRRQIVFFRGMGERRRAQMGATKFRALARTIIRLRNGVSGSRSSRGRNCLENVTTAERV